MDDNMFYIFIQKVNVECHINNSEKLNWKVDILPTITALLTIVASLLDILCH